MEQPPASPSQLADDELRDMPDSQLAARLNELNSTLDMSSNMAVAWGAHSVRVALAEGQVLEAAFKRHQGEFAEWLDSVIARDENGKPRLSLRTAFNYRTLWKKRDKVFPPDGSEPAARTMVEALQKAGIIPEALPSNSDSGEHPFFRLSFVRPAQPPALWPPSELRDFMERTKPIAELRAEAERLIQSS